MKKCPTHNVEIHVYTTFEFCPKCEDEKMAYAESAKKAAKSEITLDFKADKGILPGKQTFVSSIPLNKPNKNKVSFAPGSIKVMPSTSSRLTPMYLWTVIEEGAWKYGKQMAPVFRDKPSAELYRTHMGGEIRYTASVKQHVDWQTTVGGTYISKNEWIIFERAGMTKLDSSPKKAEII